MPVHERFARVQALAEEFERDRRKSTWWELNGEFKQVCDALRKHC